MTKPGLLAKQLTLLSGLHVNLNNPDLTGITIDDLAVSLSHLCRFVGQLPLGKFYSVAQHSVNVSRLVPKELAFEALMHDAVEAIIGDNSSPLKAYIPEIKNLEFRLEVELSRVFGFKFPFDPAIKKADLQMLGLETTVIRGMRAETCSLLDDIKFEHLAGLVCLVPLPPEDAYRQFMDRWREITDESD